MYILASDYDGTINQYGSISEQDKAAIERWRKEGNLFGIITGRGHTNICDEARLNNLTCDFFICNNGSVIYDGGLEPVNEVTADGKVLQDLVPFIIASEGWHAAITYGNKRFMVTIDNGRDKNPEENWITVNDLADISLFHQLDTRFEKDLQANEFAKEVNARFGEYVTAHQNGVCVDIVPVGVNKATGMLRYIKFKNVSKEHALVIGDNFNDLDMIIEFNGYAVSSGKSEVIAKSRKAYDNIAGLIEDFLRL